MEGIDEISIDKVCRSCLREEKGMHSLFSIYNGAAHQPTAYNIMFTANSSVSVREGDGLPELICEQCKGLLVQAYSFKLMSEEADVRLRRHLGLQSSRRETCTQTELGDCVQFYNCGHCQKKFKAISSLQRHCRRHARGNAVACTVCGHFYSNPEALSNHVDKVHNKTCLNENTKVEIWDEGVHTEEKSLAISCDLKKESPGARVRIKEEPDEHLYHDDHDNDDISPAFLVDSTVKQEYQSDQSNTPIEFERKKTSRRKNKKNNFVKGEDIPESHPCSFCTRVFASAGHLRTHETKHVASKEQKYPCGVCHKTFTRSSHLRRHQLSHSAEKDKPLCVYCNKMCDSQAQLDSHLEAEHPSGCESTKNRKVAFCSVCDRGFTTHRYLEIHTKSHLGAGAEVVRGFPCKSCQHVSQTKVEAKSHTQCHRRAERPFLCSECGQGFTRDAYLTVHMRRHRGEKPFSCSYCGKGFPRRSDLDIHERYHTEDKRHTCAICGKAFHRQYNLKVHLRVHTGERPYACTYCTKAFTQPNDLKAHVRRHTGERFTCELCSAQFLHGYHLTQHRRAVHAVDKPSHIRRLSKFPSAAPQPPTQTAPPPKRGRARQAHIQLAAHMASILAAQQQPATVPIPLSQPPPAS